MLNESIPTASASTASSTVLRMTTSPLSSRPDSSTLIGTNESNPNSISWTLLISSLPPPPGHRPPQGRGGGGELFVRSPSHPPPRARPRQRLAPPIRGVEPPLE